MLFDETVAVKERPAINESRPVSLIHADIVGSTTAISGLNEEAARQYLDEAIDIVRQGVRAFGGHIVRIQGDGVLAIFGTTSIREDHALRAVLASNWIVTRFKEKAKANAQAAQIRVGVHSGSVFLRWQSHDFGTMLDAVGEAVHITARVERTSRPNSLAVSDSVISLLPEPLEVTTIGSIAASESTSRIAIYELKEAPSIDSATFDTIKGAIVGRHSELARISELLSNIRTGQEAQLAIVGRPGIGKSRLCGEAAERANEAGILPVVIKGRQLQMTQPFAALRSAFAQLTKDSASRSSDDLMNFLVANQLDQYVAMRLIETLASDRFDLTAAKPVMPDALRQSVIQGLCALTRCRAKQAPILLLCDDIQYLDSASLAYLSHLIKNPDQNGLGVSLFGREEAAPTIEGFGVQPIHLTALDLSSAETLVGNILGLEDGHDRQAARTAMDQILARSEGLPLALVEFANYANRQRDDAPADSGLSLPIKIETVFRAKLDALNEHERKLCDIASVIGIDVTADQLEGLAQEKSLEFHELLEVLFERDILKQQPNGRLQFSHQLFYEATYSSLAQAVKAHLHADVFSFLVRQDKAAPNLDLARHAHNAGQLDQALGYYWKACREAVALADVYAALDIYEKAQQLCSQIGASAKPNLARFAMLAFDAAQQLAEQEKCYEDLQIITARQIEVDEGTLMVANAHQAMVNWIGGRGKEGLLDAQRAHASLNPDMPLASRWYVEFALGILEFSNSLPQASLSRLVDIVGELSDTNAEKKFGAVASIPGFLARAFGGWIASDLGEFDVAQSLCVEAIEIADRLNHNSSRLIGRIAEGHYHLRYDDANRAVEILDKAYEICVKYGFHGYEPSTSSRLASSLLRQGDTQRAADVVQKSLDAKHHLKIINSSSHLLYDAEARVCDALGQSDIALEKIEKAIERCRLLGDGVQASFAQLFSIQMRIKLNGQSSVSKGEIQALNDSAKSMGLKRLVSEIEELGLT